MRCWCALGALAVASCFAEPPRPALPGELGGCHAGAYGALSELACRVDSDCLLCGASCELTTRERVALRAAACPRPRCEHRAACCEGRCVRSLGPPAF